MSTAVQADSTAAASAFQSEEGKLTPSFDFLPGDTELELESGGAIRFDSVLEWGTSEEPKSIRFQKTEYFASNTKGSGPLLLGKNKHLRLAPDKYCVTLLRDPDHTLGKVFDVTGKKRATVQVSRATAKTVRCETLQALAEVYEKAGADAHAALILDYFPGIPVGEPFEVISQAQMRASLGSAGTTREDVLGVQHLDPARPRIKSVVRFRENFAPSVWLAIDRDIDAHTPPAFAELTNSEYFDELAKALPGINGVGRIRTLSSSGRAMRNGEPMGRHAGHTLIQLTDASAKGRLRTAYRTQAIATGTAWTVPKYSKADATRVVAHGWKCLADDATFDVGRLLFCGSPVSECPDIVIAAQKCVVEPGPEEAFDADRVVPADPSIVTSASRAAGCPVVVRKRDDGALVFEDDSLTLDSEIETERNGLMTVREAAVLLRKSAGPEKLRCQAPYRESSSFAAFMRLASGYPVLHDSGTGTTYRLNGIERCMLDFGDLPDEPAVAPLADRLGSDPAEPVRDRRAPLRVLSPAELRTLPPAKWRIQGLLPEIGIAVLYGPSGAGKSFVALSMALALARGVEWHGMPVAQCGVLYVAAEGSSGFRSRVAAYAAHHACDLDAEPFWLVPEAIDLMASDDPQLVIDAALSRHKAVGVIVLDTLNRSMTGDENSAADMTRVISSAARISSATGALVLIITHTGKDEDRGARGHSSLRAAADAEFYVHGRGEIRIFEVTKMRDSSDDLRFGFRLEPVQMTDSETGSTSSVPVVAPAYLEGPPGQGCPRPGTWEAIILGALGTAEKRFESVQLPGVPRETLLSYVHDAYRDEKGDLPARWRDTALRSLSALVARGTLREDRGHFAGAPT